MICKIFIYIIIAISYFPIISAKGPPILDINNYAILQKPGEPPPKNYNIIKFISSSSSKASSVVFGPIQIWEGITTGERVESVELEVLSGIPQLVTIQASIGSESKYYYYKWEKGKFISESKANYLSYQTILKEDDILLDYTIILDIKKEPTKFAFNKDHKTISGFRFDTITPKSYFTLIGVFHENTFIYQHDSIESVDILRISSGPRLVFVKLSEVPEPKRFIYDNGWKECDEHKVNQFLNELANGTPKTSKSKDPQTSPAKPGEPFYTTLQPSLLLPKVFTETQLVSMNLIKQCPTIPTQSIPGTSINTHSLIFDINFITPDYSTTTEFFGNFNIITINPKEGFNISQMIESEIPIWTNSRNSKVKEIIIYERKHLPVLIILKTDRYGEKLDYFYRDKGKFSTCGEFEFRKLFIEWKETENFDNSISYSLYGLNNQHLFKSINKLVDGVHFMTIHPKEGYDFMRIVNGSNHITRGTEEKWSTFTITYFGPINKLISLNVVINDKSHVRYFKCIGSLVEIDHKTQLKLFQQYKSNIHIQSNIIFDLSKNQNAGYTSQIEYSTEISPTSGFHVKMVKIGDFVIWKSQESRCTSVVLTTPETLCLVKLNINTNETLSQEYYRIFTNKAFKIPTIEEYDFIKKKFIDNLKNPSASTELTKLTYDLTKQYNLLVFDASGPNKSVITYTTMSSLVLSTTYGPKDDYVFGEIRYGTRVLWKTADVNYYCTNLVLYFFKTEPRLGILYIVKNGKPITEYFYYGEPNPKSLDKNSFDNKHNELTNTLNMTQVQSLGYQTTLDLLKFDNFNANGTRKSGLFSVEYTHKEKIPIQLISFGYEILWASKGVEGANKVLVVYYDMQPLLLELTMNDQSQTVKYFSHFNRIWHKIDPIAVENELNNIASLEPQRRGFTLPTLDEITDYDGGSTKDEYFTTKKFFSKDSLITTILDGRNRIHIPDSLSFVESLMLYYHGTRPRLLSFREKNVFGYHYDYHLVFTNGWRYISFVQFEQLFNHYRTRPPKDLCAKNQFIFDILQQDPRVIISRLSTERFGFQFTVKDDELAFCSVKAGDKVIWSVPKRKYLKKFYVYYDGNIPTLAKFEEKDVHNDVELIYTQREGSEWTEVDASVFEGSMAILTQKYFSNPEPLQSPPIHVPDVILENLPPISPQEHEMFPEQDKKTFILPPGSFERSTTPSSLKDLFIPPTQKHEAFIPSTREEVSTTTQPGSITASTLPSQTSTRPPTPTPTPSPSKKRLIAPIHIPPVVSLQKPPTSPVRSSPKIPGMIPILPDGSISLDILAQENRKQFRYGSGHCEEVVPFKEIKPRVGFHIRLVSTGNKIAWYTDNSSYTCVAVKIFFRENIPVLMEFLIKDSIKNTSKYIFASFDDENWNDCDEDTFDVTLDSLVSYYKNKFTKS